jgi:hypothetical protein
MEFIATVLLCFARTLTALNEKDVLLAFMQYEYNEFKEASLLPKFKFLQ